MELTHSGKSTKWQCSLLTALSMVVFSACASSPPKIQKKTKPNIEKSVSTENEKYKEPTLFKKATSYFIPKPKAPPLLPYQKDLKAAQYRFNLQEFPEAEHYLKKVFLQFPEEPSALKLLPWTYFFQSKFDKALLAFERNLAIHPRDPATIAGMGWCYLSMNNHNMALETFLRAEKYSPASLYDIHKGRAIIYLKQKNPEQALPHLSKIYNPREIEHLLAFWKSNGDKLSESSYPVLPNKPGAPSLFTLPEDGPRYLSMLWGLDRPDSPSPELETAWRYYRQGLYRRALQAFQKLPENLNQSLDAKNGLAWSYLKTKEIQKADAVFALTAQTYPRFSGVMNGLQESENIKMQKAAFGQYYYDLNKFRIAEEKFEALRKEYPGWAHSYVQLGRIALKNNDLESAQNFFHQAQDLSPKDEGVLAGLEDLENLQEPELYKANQAFKFENHKEAARLYHDYIEYRKPAVQLTPSLARAYNGLGWSQYHKGQFNLALENFKQSRKYVELKSDSLRGMGLCYFQLKRYQDATTHLKFIHDHHPDEKQENSVLDWSILHSWKNNRAQRYFDRQILIDPLRVSLYMGLGWIHYKNGKPDLAVEYFLKAISMDPDSVVSEDFFNLLENQRFGWQVFNRLGWAYYHKSKYSRSIEMFQISLKERPESAGAHKGIGYNLYQMKKYASAIKYLEQALMINPNSTPVLETVMDGNNQIPQKIRTTARTKLARAHYHSGNYLKAVRLYKKDLAFHTELADAHAGLGWAYLKLRRLTESRAAFTESLKLEPLKTRSHKGLKEVKQLLATQNIRVKQSTLPKSSLTFTHQKISPN